MQKLVGFFPLSFTFGEKKPFKNYVFFLKTNLIKVQKWYSVVFNSNVFSFIIPSYLVCLYKINFIYRIVRTPENRYQAFGFNGLMNFYSKIISQCFHSLFFRIVQLEQQNLTVIWVTVKILLIKGIWVLLIRN